MTGDRDRLRIVIVDDDQPLAGLMREFLTDEGYQVEVCSQGDQAFPIIQALLPDLIILDVRMAEINGLGVLYLLSTNPRTRQIPVLMCTAISAGELEQWEAVLDQKGVTLLFKPFELGQLAERVASLLARPPAGLPGAADAATPTTPQLHD